MTKLIHLIDIMHLKCKYEDIFCNKFLDIIKHSTNILQVRCDVTERNMKIINPNSKLKDNGLIYQKYYLFTTQFCSKILDFDPLLSAPLATDIKESTITESKKEEDVYHNCIIIQYNKMIFYVNTIQSDYINNKITMIGIEIKN